MKLFITFMLLFVTQQLWAIKYYKGTGGSIKEIDAAALSTCSKIYYRNAAKSELPPEHQKNLVKASLKGELFNDLGAVTGKLKDTGLDGTCTYGENSESVQ